MDSDVRYFLTRVEATWLPSVRTEPRQGSCASPALTPGGPKVRTQATSSSLVLAAGLALGLGACDQDGGRAGLVPDGPTRLPGAADSDGAGGDGDQGNGDCVPGSDCSAAQPEPRKPLTAEQTRSYLSRIAPIIAGRSLRYEGIEAIDADGTVHFTETTQKAFAALLGRPVARLEIAGAAQQARDILGAL